MRSVIRFVVLVSLTAHAGADHWEKAARNGEQTQKVIRFCNRFVWGWLNHVDPKTGLIPRNLQKDFYWNAQDAAADNYPFMVLTAEITGNFHMKRIMREILRTEQKFANRLDSLPDDFLFKTQSFRTETYDLTRLIFGASEYAKDGLMPVTEWIGPSPWLDRMQDLIRDIWKHAPVETPFGKIPSRSVEVNGEMMQTMSRLYWMTRDRELLEKLFRISDYYLFEEDILAADSLRLDDHGCEIIGGLAEVYLIASKVDRKRWKTYKRPMHRILDRVLEVGANEDGMLYNRVHPKTGEIQDDDLTDNWGYNYNAFLVVAEVDREERYREAVVKVLSNIHKYVDFLWERRGGADGYADSVEGGINLLNRIPDESAFDWVDESMEILFAKQQSDGIIEGWHGDGNSARTAILYALLKTQGVTASPWREDLKLGAVREDDGTLCVYLECRWPWNGELRFDRPRHKRYFRMPYDYPRLNQFPEWFTVRKETEYVLEVGDKEPLVVGGGELLSYDVSVDPDSPLKLRVRERNGDR